MIKHILNLTQHNATIDQIEAGVYDPAPEDVKVIRKLLTFETIPSALEMKSRAAKLRHIAFKYFNVSHSTSNDGNLKVMIAGAPFFMPILEQELRSNSCIPLYAFSKRECVEEKQPDGTTRISRVFKHIGFVEGVVGQK